MGTNDNDTDPSTPSARRPSAYAAVAAVNARTSAAALAAANAPTPPESTPALETPPPPPARPPSIEVPTPVLNAPISDASLAEFRPVWESEGAPTPPQFGVRNINQTDPGVGPPSPVRSLTPKPIGVVVPRPGSTPPPPPTTRPPPAPRTPLPPSRSPSATAISGAQALAQVTSGVAGAPSNAGPARPAAFPPPAAHPRADSVEILLDGIAGPRPERPKTTPQTDGQASAFYHAEHGVLRPRAAAQTPVGSVLVDRPVATITPRAIPLAAVAALRASRGPREQDDPTIVTRRVLARRITLAVVGGLFVVALLFLVIHFSGTWSPSPSRAATPAPAMTPSLPVAPDPVRVAPEPPVVTAAPRATADRGPTLPAEAASAGDSPHVTARPAGGPNLTHRRRKLTGVPLPIPSPSASAEGDTGEFKTSM